LTLPNLKPGHGSAPKYKKHFASAVYLTGIGGRFAEKLKYLAVLLHDSLKVDNEIH